MDSLFNKFYVIYLIKLINLQLLIAFSLLLMTLSQYIYKLIINIYKHL